jgi:hypothetical protein
MLALWLLHANTVSVASPRLFAPVIPCRGESMAKPLQAKQTRCISSWSFYFERLYDLLNPHFADRPWSSQTDFRQTSTTTSVLDIHLEESTPRDTIPRFLILSSRTKPGTTLVALQPPQDDWTDYSR